MIDHFNHFFSDFFVDFQQCQLWTPAKMLLLRILLKASLHLPVAVLKEKIPMIKKAYSSAFDSLIQGTLKISETIEKDIMTDFYAFNHFLQSKEIQDIAPIPFYVYRFGKSNGKDE